MAFLTNRDFGLLFLRLGLGILFVIHGYPKLMGGPSQWAFLGSQMGHLGINFLPTFWGFMAACTEFFGGVFLIVGLFHRLACFFLAFVMLVAMLFHFGKGEGLMGASHALELMIVFLGFIFMGPGKYSVQGGA